MKRKFTDEEINEKIKEMKIIYPEQKEQNKSQSGGKQSQLIL